ncbi:MAG: hypothetical protein AB7U35_14915 [Sphingobium sp.]
MLSRVGALAGLTCRIPIWIGCLGEATEHLSVMKKISAGAASARFERLIPEARTRNRMRAAANRSFFDEK